MTQQAEREETTDFKPAFNKDGLITCVTTDIKTGEVLMVAYMNEEALGKTLQTGEAHYWSRSRNELWHKGKTSGQIQKVIKLSIDCDQDAIWLQVDVQGNGGACHTGRKTCFYREINLTKSAEINTKTIKLDFKA